MGVSAPYLRNPSTLRPLYIGGSLPHDLPLPLGTFPYLWTSPLPHDSAQLDIFGDQLELLKFLYVLWFSPSPLYITYFRLMGVLLVFKRRRDMKY